MNAWTREAVEALGPTTNVPTTAAIFGVDPETVYAQIRRGEWTATRVLRLGRKLKIPTRDLLALLYAPEMDAAPSAHRPASAMCHHEVSPQVTGHVIEGQPHSQCGCTPELSGDVRPLRKVT